LIARLADDRRANDVVVLDVGDITPLTDYFVIADVPTRTQVRAIADHIEDELKGRGISRRHREGRRGRVWILLDYGSVVVHLFRVDERRFYDLERLWRDAPRIDWGQGTETPGDDAAATAEGGMLSGDPGVPGDAGGPAL